MASLIFGDLLMLGESEAGAEYGGVARAITCVRLVPSPTNNARARLKATNRRNRLPPSEATIKEIRRGKQPENSAEARELRDHPPTAAAPQRKPLQRRHLPTGARCRCVFYRSQIASSQRILRVS